MLTDGCNPEFVIDADFDGIFEIPIIKKPKHFSEVTMNKFELFTMIYFWLDNYYESTTDDRILNQLSEMNPFLWKDIGSADPAVYSEFCKFLGERDISVENSLSIAKEYVATIDYVDVTAAFENIDPEEWIRGCEKYLATEHKGSDISD